MNPAVAVVVHRDEILAAAERRHLADVKVYGYAASGVWDSQLGLIVTPTGEDQWTDVLAFWDAVVALTGCTVEVLHASSSAARIVSKSARAL